jgi:sugar phosphate isomerase/epimerase
MMSVPIRGAEGYMRNEFSLAHLSALSLSPPEMVDVAARVGYHYVGLRLTPVTANEPRYPLPFDAQMMSETQACLADTGVEVLDIELARLAPETTVESFAPMLEAGAQLGARHVIAQTPDRVQARAIEKFGRLCELARPLQLSVDLEFITWTDTADLDAAAAIVTAVAQPNAGVLIDTLHFCRSGCSVEALRAMPRSWFRFAQVCDAPAQAPQTTAGLIHAARNERLFLGDGGLDVRRILDALPADIPYSLEIPMTTLARTLGPELRAHMALLSARRYLLPAARRLRASLS